MICPDWRRAAIACPRYTEFPEDDRRDHKVKAAGAMLLVFIRPVSDFAQPVEEHRAGEGITRLALVQPHMDAPPQVNVLHVLQQEQRPFQPADLPKGGSQRILPRIGPKFSQHKRGGDGSVPDGSR